MTIISVPHYSPPLTLEHETCKYIHTIGYLESRYISFVGNTTVAEFSTQNATNITRGLKPD
jgi:hypothetical protein